MHSLAMAGAKPDGFQDTPIHVLPMPAHTLQIHGAVPRYSFCEVTVSSRGIENILDFFSAYQRFG